MVALHNSGPILFLNCCKVLIHLWILCGALGQHWKNFKNLCLSSCNAWEMYNWHCKTTCGTCWESSQRYNILKVLIEPVDIDFSPKFKDTLQIHMSKWFYDEQNVPYLQFFKMNTSNKPSLTQNFLDFYIYWKKSNSKNHRKNHETTQESFG